MEVWGVGVGKNLRKVKKSIFAISFCFDPTSLGESPATSYAASRPLSHPLTHLNPSLTLHIRALSSAKVGCGVDMSKIFEKSAISNFDRTATLRKKRLKSQILVSFRDFSRFSEELCVRVPRFERVTFRPKTQVSGLMVTEGSWHAHLSFRKARKHSLRVPYRI